MTTFTVRSPVALLRRAAPGSQGGGTRARRLPLAVPLLALLLLVGLLGGTAAAQLTDEDVAKLPQSDQPIKFSHRIHAGDNKIACQYCHIFARRSKVSGVPPVSICMGCHKFVNPQLGEIQKVAKFWETQTPIPWVKIHDIPDFVRFTHEKHVNAHNELFPNGVPCQTCHGPIETEDVVHKVDSSFGEMGWCLSCHLKVPGTQDQKWAIPSAPGSMLLANATHPGGYPRPRLTDCLTCHY